MPWFTKRIHMHAHAALQLGERLGRATLEINGEGEMIMAFGPRISLDPWDIRILRVDLTFDTFNLPRPHRETKHHNQEPRRETEHHIQIERLHITGADFNLRRCHGQLNRETGEVILHLEIVLQPDRFPVLRELGVEEPLHVTVDEEGHMDFVQGRIIQTHARTFQIPSNLPEGLLEVRAGQNSCEAIGNLFVGVAGGGLNQNTIQQYRPTKVYLCPGSQLILAWLIDNYPKAKSAQITGGGIAPIHIAQPSGATMPIPAPAATTTFTLEVIDTNNCSNNSYVDVVVVTPGAPVDIQATLEGAQIWSAVLPPVMYDPKIMVTSIYSNLCSLEVIAFSDWALQKIDQNGAVHAVQVSGVPGPLNQFPLAGFYNFSPLNTGQLIVSPGYDPTNYGGPPPEEENLACFTATVTCS